MNHEAIFYTLTIIALFFSESFVISCSKGTSGLVNADNQVRSSFKEIEDVFFNSGQGWMSSTQLPCGI